MRLGDPPRGQEGVALIVTGGCAALGGPRRDQTVRVVIHKVPSRSASTTNEGTTPNVSHAGASENTLGTRNATVTSINVTAMPSRLATTMKTVKWPEVSSKGGHSAG